MEGRVNFEFTRSYKNDNWPPMHPKESKIKMMSTTIARFVEESYLTQEKPREAATTPKIRKCPRTLLHRKHAWASPQFNKLSIVENGKAITMELEEDEEDLQALITLIEAQDEEEEHVPQVSSTIILPPYISPWKGTPKIPKDLEATKSTLQTPLLPDEIRFDGLPLGRIQNIKFEDWDLADSEKFPQLAKEKLLQQKCLWGVAKARLLNLRLIPHYHCAAITIFVI